MMRTFSRLAVLLVFLLPVAVWPASQASYAQSANTDTPTPTVVGGTLGPTAIPIFEVTTATPYPDGSIIHIVQWGQTISGIAEAYGISINDLLALNNRNLSDNLNVGDKLLIRPAITATPTSDATETFTPRPPTATHRPTRTATAPRPTRTPFPTAPFTVTPTPVSILGVDPVGNVMAGAVVVLFSAGVLLVLIGVVLRGGWRAPRAISASGETAEDKDKAN